VVENAALPDPDLPIIDPHHHLSSSNHWGDGRPYLLPEFAADLSSGHRVVATVYVESSAFYRNSGPEHLRPVGEVEFAVATARLAETGQYGPARACEGIVAHADLLSGDLLDETLAILAEASEGRLRGIRYSATWDPDPQLSTGARGFAPRGLMAHASFRSGVRKVAAANLVYDAWQFYPQLGELGDLADTIADATIVCGHAGGLIGKHAYSGADNFQNWRTRVVDLARHPNVFMKIGGLAHERTGFGFRARAVRPTEAELISLWRPYVETCIEAFGAGRCMFESNFPVDAVATDYCTLWSIFKKIAAGCSRDEKSALFSGTARRVYRLQH
jgi:L-fuconolactonase